MKELNNEDLEWITNLTNRSKAQTQYLFELVEYDFEKLKQLEMKIHNCFIFYCPADSNEIQFILNLADKTNTLKL